MSDHRAQLEAATAALADVAERLAGDGLPDDELRELAEQVSRLSAEVARLLPLALGGDA